MSQAVIKFQAQQNPFLIRLRQLQQCLQLRLDKRRQRRQLAELTIEQLTDMGIDPADAMIEIQKPFWK
jgi:uncharacterized protein YjiS (DUF1127 family)